VYYRLTDPAVAELLATARALLLVLLEHDGAMLDDARALPAIGLNSR
jgi:ArsR family transcriptional regulator